MPVWPLGTLDHFTDARPCVAGPAPCLGPISRLPGTKSGLCEDAALPMTSRLANACRTLADSQKFQGFIFVVIVTNAVVLGLQTYDGVEHDAGDALDVLNDACLGVFVVEMAIRITAYAPRPGRFFNDGWNVFDFSTVAAAFIPGVRENATLLRLVRLLRVVRIVSILPDLRVLVRGMVRSLPPIGSMAVLALLLMYVYGMIGWVLFGDELPDRWGNIGEAMLTLFTVLTLEGWNDVLDQAREVHSQAWIFFVSYVLLASFLLINILIAIIINSIEEAREAHREERIEDARHEAEEAGEEVSEDVEVEARLLALRNALEDLETELAVRDHLEHGTKKRLRASGRRGRA